MESGIQNSSSNDGTPMPPELQSKLSDLESFRMLVKFWTLLRVQSLALSRLLDCVRLCLGDAESGLVACVKADLYVSRS